MAEKKKDKKKSGKETRKKKGKKTVSAAKKVKKPSRPAAAKKRKEVMPEVKQPIEIKPVIISPIEKKLAPRSARNLAKLLVAVFAVLLIIIGSWLWRPYKYCRTVPIMGTFMQVKVVGNGLFRWRLPEEADRAIKLARGLEKKFSIYDPNSEINALNIEKMRVVSLELFNLINKAKRISHVTNGTFDITIAPILKKNGFYEDMPEEIRDKIPDDFSGVGIKNVILRLDNSVRLRNGAWIDLSGIAKGNIVDNMMAYFRGKGIKNVLINAGGDLYCAGEGEGRPWIVGVREPGSDRILLTLAVRDMAVATSGDYENVVIDERTGEVISHIIDPFRERPIKEKFYSVTVIAPTCTDADALATGMMVMDKDAAIALADEIKDVSIIVIKTSGDENSIFFSKGAKEYLAKR